MIIAVDIDEVLSATVPAFIEFYNSNYGARLTYADFTHWSWADCIEEDPSILLPRVDDFFRSREFEELDAVEGSVLATAELARDHRLVAVTSRWGEAAKRTPTWLESRFGDTFSSLYFTHNPIPGVSSDSAVTKVELCRREGAAVIVDDSLELVASCAEAGLPVILYDRPWNASENGNGFMRARNWIEVAQHVDALG